MSKALLLTPFLALAFVLASLTNVLAVAVDVSGNGAGSNNTVNYTQQNNQNVNQNNQSNVSNNVNANCNTGGNSANSNTGGSTGVNTGNCTSNVNIQNNLNNNQATVGCCGKASPTPQVSPSPGVGGPGGPGGGRKMELRHAGVQARPDAGLLCRVGKAHRVLFQQRYGPEDF